MTHYICCVGLLSLVTICEALGYRSNIPYQWSSSRRCLFCWDWVLFINQWKIIRKIRLFVWRAKLNFQKQTWLVNLHYIIQIQFKFYLPAEWFNKYSRRTFFKSDHNTWSIRSKSVILLPFDSSYRFPRILLITMMQDMQNIKIHSVFSRIV